ncbi:stage II sporulation protein D [Alteribacter natronophilus]|uniref:stage II sporulation protein D n=1 Tax=Alteribacter natronophilus TaxID=2583810 RepID=UPI00110D297E|nr:stage II sporulation protein D [Alteribacter natronophilus]TMW72186.1 stage II sporulation protein D [Alteribacter natronophilus]
MKPILFTGLILMGIILLLPSVLVVWLSEDDVHQEAVEVSASPENVQVPRDTEAGGGDEPLVAVYRSQNEIVEHVDFETYVAGVVASEMPASYEMEALKAQALTARTYIVRQLMSPSDIHVPDGADVTDTVMHQVYQSEEELRQRFGADYDDMMGRIHEAVAATRGQVITYDGRPITATFFSTSNGYTENSEEYWENEIPYLRSVESPWDKESPRYDGEKIVSPGDMAEKLGVTIAGEGGIGEIVERTTGGRVAKVRFGDKEFTGREIRDLLGLDSSDFSWERHGGDILFKTRGWGHGVGMSQFGADGMAREGKTYEQIIHHYYHNVEIEDTDDVIGVAMAGNE